MWEADGESDKELIPHLPCLAKLRLEIKVNEELTLKIQKYQNVKLKLNKQKKAASVKLTAKKKN